MDQGVHPTLILGPYRLCHVAFPIETKHPAQVVRRGAELSRHVDLGGSRSEVGSPSSPAVLFGGGEPVGHDLPFASAYGQGRGGLVRRCGQVLQRKNDTAGHLRCSTAALGEDLCPCRRRRHVSPLPGRHGEVEGCGGAVGVVTTQLNRIAVGWSSWGKPPGILVDTGEVSWKALRAREVVSVRWVHLGGGERPARSGKRNRHQPTHDTEVGQRSWRQPIRDVGSAAPTDRGYCQLGVVVAHLHRWAAFWPR